MTTGLRKQIERAKALMQGKPKMEVVVNHAKVTKSIEFNLKELNMKLFK